LNAQAAFVGVQPPDGGRRLFLRGQQQQFRQGVRQRLTGGRPRQRIEQWPPAEVAEHAAPAQESTESLGQMFMHGKAKRGGAILGLRAGTVGAPSHSPDSAQTAHRRCTTASA
jgi:hypothetical protein